jgi:DNA repair ATPase RecN
MKKLRRKRRMTDNYFYIVSTHSIEVRKVLYKNLEGIAKDFKDSDYLEVERIQCKDFENEDQEMPRLKLKDEVIKRQMTDIERYKNDIQDVKNDYEALRKSKNELAKSLSKNLEKFKGYYDQSEKIEVLQEKIKFMEENTKAKQKLIERKNEEISDLVNYNKDLKERLLEYD